MSIKRAYSLFFIILLFFFITFFLYYSFFLIPHIKDLLITEKKQELLHHIEFAESLLLNRFTKDSKHELREYLEFLEKLNYGKEHTYYFAISKDGVLLMHPFRKDLVGKNVRTFQDKNGVFVFLEILKTIENKNIGFAYYSWDNPADPNHTEQKKITCVKYLKSLNIAIGSGVYISDIDKQLTTIKKNMFVYTIALLMLIFGIIIFLMLIFKKTLERLYYEEIIGNASFNNEMQFMAILDTKGRIKKINKTAIDTIDLKFSEIKGKYFWDSPWWNHSQETMNKLKESIKKAAQGEVIRYQAINSLKDNKLIQVDFSLRPVFMNNGNIIHLIAEGRDITDMLKFKDDSMTKASFIDTLLSQTPNPIIVFDHKFNRHKVNKIWESSPDKEKLESILRSKAKQLNEKKEKYIIEKIDFPESGKFYNITLFPVIKNDGIIEAYIGSASDISNKWKIEEHLIKTKKMASIGKVAKNLLNEINNPVSSILQSIQNLERRLDIYNDKNIKTCEEIGLNTETLKKYIIKRDINELFNIIRISEKRLSNLIEELNVYVTSDNKSKEPVNVNDLFIDIKKQIFNNINSLSQNQKDEVESITFNLNLSNMIGKIPINYSNITQAIYNILVNAIEALLNKNSNRRININTYSQNNKIVIEISNNGPAIDHKLIDTIFEPFVSDKGPEHSGNGLFYSYYVISQEHGGDLFVDSSHLETTFTIKLPM